MHKYKMNKDLKEKIELIIINNKSNVGFRVINRIKKRLSQSFDNLFVSNSEEICSVLMDNYYPFSMYIALKKTVKCESKHLHFLLI